MSIQTAKDRITEESKKGVAPILIGTYITDILLTNEENAEKILNPKKSLSGAYQSIKNHAQKEATNGMAMIEDNEVFGWVREYYEISDLTVVKQAPKPPAGPDLGNISLFDLL